MAKKKKKAENKKPAPAAEPAAATPAGQALPLRLARSRGLANLLFLAALILLAFFLYGRTLNATFVFDDSANLRDNPRIRVYDLSPQSLARAATARPSSSRLVPNISFALNFYFGRYNPRGWHIVNICVHALAAFGLFLLVGALFRTPWARSRGLGPGIIPWFAALLFLAHPTATQAVSYIVQRMTSMAAMFYIWSVYFYALLRTSPPGASRKLGTAACILCGLLALGSKQNALTLPAFLMLFEWFFISDLDGSWFRRYGPWLLGALAVMLAVGLVYTRFRPLEGMIDLYKFRDFTLGERVMTQFRVVVHYISLVLLPFPGRMNLDYDFPLSTGLFSPATTFLCLLLIIGLLASAVLAARRHRLYSFALLWFFGNLAIESSVFPLEMVFEHRIYLPSMMLFAALAAALSSRLGAKTAAAVLGVLALLLSAATISRNQVWKDDVSLFADVVKKSPEKARPNYSYCSVLYDDNRPAEGLPYCEKATRLNPKDAKGWFLLGRTLEHRSIKQPDKAEQAYRQALAADKYSARAANALALLLARRGQGGEALSLTAQAVGYEPENPVVLLNASKTLLALDRPEEAELRLQEALVTDPGYARARGNLAIVYAKQGKWDLAEKEWLGSLSGEPEDCVTYHNLGNLMERLGRKEEALLYYKKAIRANPGFGPSREAAKALQADYTGS